MWEYQVARKVADLLLLLRSACGPRLPTRHAPVHGSYRTNTRKVILALSISADDPQETFGDLLLDHLVGTQQERFRDREAERLRGLEIDHQLESCGRLHRKIGWLGACKARRRSADGH